MVYKRTAIILSVILLLCSSFVSAIEFESDSAYSTGNLNFIFKKGYVVKDFELIDNGIVLDKEDTYVFNIQGGQLTIYLHPDDSIELASSVPQNVQFTVLKDDIKQYLLINGTNYLENYYIEERAVFRLQPTRVTETTNVVDEIIAKDDWHQKKIFSIEVWSEENENGIIDNTVWNFTYIQLALVVIFLLIGGILWLFLRR